MHTDTNGAGHNPAKPFILVSTKEGYRASAAEQHLELKQEVEELQLPGVDFEDFGKQLVTINHKSSDPEDGSLTLFGYIGGLDVERDYPNGNDRFRFDELVHLDILPVAIEYHGYGPVCPGCSMRSFPTDHSPDCPVFDMSLDLQSITLGPLEIKLWKYVIDPDRGRFWLW